MKRQHSSSSKGLRIQAYTAVSAGEILSAGGSAAYAKQVKTDATKVFNLPGEAISEEDLKKALEDLAGK